MTAHVFALLSKSNRKRLWMPNVFEERAPSAAHHRFALSSKYSRTILFHSPRDVSWRGHQNLHNHFVNSVYTRLLQVEALTALGVKPLSRKDLFISPGPKVFL